VYAFVEEEECSKEEEARGKNREVKRILHSAEINA